MLYGEQYKPVMNIFSDFKFKALVFSVVVMERMPHCYFITYIPLPLLFITLYLRFATFIIHFRVTQFMVTFDKNKKGLIEHES